MTRGCALCQRAPAKKSLCCGQRLCADCVDSHTAAGKCPRSNELAAIADDPKKQREWLKANEPEEAMTTALVDALNDLPEIEMAWQSRRRGGFAANDAARAVGDITAVARGGWHVEVEMKGTHKDDCRCASCAAQRDRGERIRGAGGVYVDGVRNVQQGVDGVRMALAKARARHLERTG